MTIKLNKIYAQLEAWRGERSNLTGLRHCERSEAIPFKVKKLNNEIASVALLPRNDELDGDLMRLLRSRCSLAMTEFSQ